MKRTVMILAAAVLTIFCVGSSAWAEDTDSHELAGSYEDYEETGLVMEIDDTGHITTNIHYVVEGNYYPIVFKTRLRQVSGAVEYQTEGYTDVVFYDPYFPNTITCRAKIYLTVVWDGPVEFLDAYFSGPAVVGVTSNGMCYGSGRFEDHIEFQKTNEG